MVAVPMPVSLRVTTLCGVCALAACDASSPPGDAPDAAPDVSVVAPLDVTNDTTTTDVFDTSAAPDVAAPPRDATVDAGVEDVAAVVDAPRVDAPETSVIGCSGLPLCDDFEGVAAGAPPDPARWMVVSPNCSGSGRIAVDDAQAHGGSRSVRVDGGGGYCDHVFFANTAVISTLGGVVFGRFFVRFADALGDGHVTFVTMRDMADGNRDLRMGGQSRILMWNRESDDATLPELSPNGIARSVRPTPGRWTCVEFRVDTLNGTLDTWVDGTLVDGLQIDATPTMDVDQQWLRRANWRPRLTDVKFGWESYAGMSTTLWFDDVALASRRVGCGASP
jgi:hypothetical protein